MKYNNTIFIYSKRSTCVVCVKQTRCPDVRRSPTARKMSVVTRKENYPWIRFENNCFRKGNRIYDNLSHDLTVRLYPPRYYLNVGVKNVIKKKKKMKKKKKKNPITRLGKQTLQIGQEIIAYCVVFVELLHSNSTCVSRTLYRVSYNCFTNCKITFC